MDSRTEEFLAYVQGGGQAEAGDWLPDEYRQKLIKFIEMHANSELMGVLPERDWILRAPTLQRKLALTAKVQDEVGHARALYELAAQELGTDADALAFDRPPDEYRCAPLVELHLLEWAHTIARRYLYEEADRVRIEALMRSDDETVAGLAAKIDREEVYHRMHAELWAARLRDEPRFRAAVEELWPYALGVVPPELRPELARRVGLDVVEAKERGEHTPALVELWEEMTEVRRSAPGAEW